MCQCQGLVHPRDNDAACKQVDVIEAQSAVLFERMRRAGDFGDAESAHAEFLAAVLEQTLLASPKVAHALEAIYALCTRLCGLVQVILLSLAKLL